MGKDKSKKKKRSRERSRSDSSDSCSSGSLRERKMIKKMKRKLKKQKKADKKLKKIMKIGKKVESEILDEKISADVPVELMEISKSMAPMTKEEWDKRQSVVRKVLDEETGRYRLIKGDGEVLEEIVSRNRHKEINRSATRADGEFFQSKTVGRHF